MLTHAVKKCPDKQDTKKSFLSHEKRRSVYCTYKCLQFLLIKTTTVGPIELKYTYVLSIKIDNIVDIFFEHFHSLLFYIVSGVII